VQHSVYVTGTGPNIAMALETALKLREAGSIVTEGMETE
jgi:glucosamine 6-phosphate synthetase-like amidotransferase/phosphosugar isomerase protein